MLNPFLYKQRFLFHTIWFSVNTVSMSKIVLFQTIQLSMSAEFNFKTVLFQSVQFNISTEFSSIWPIDRTLSGATTPEQSGPRRDGNNEVLRIPQSSNMSGASPSGCFVSFAGHSLARVFPFYRHADPSLLGKWYDLCVCVCMFWNQRWFFKRLS